MTEDRCVVCGEMVPEGRMVCVNCENNFNISSNDAEKRYGLGKRFWEWYKKVKGEVNGD